MKHVTMKNWILWGLAAVVLTGCHWDLWDQDRFEPLEAGVMFGEGESSSRPLVEGTVPFQGAHTDTAYYKGQDAEGNYIAELPSQVTFSKELLERGQERFTIYCSACHGEQGLGNGMITKRGFPAPPSYTDQRLLEVPVGYFFDVMTNGFGRMYSYASRVTVEDRWAIASYIRVLQLSQNATPDLLTEELLNKAKNPPAVAEDSHGGGHDAAPADGHAADANEKEEEGHGEQ